MKKINSLFHKIGVIIYDLIRTIGVKLKAYVIKIVSKISVFFGGLVVLFIYNPLRFIVLLIANLFLLLIKLIKSISSSGKNQTEDTQSCESCKFRNLLTTLGTIKPYSGENSYIKLLDTKFMPNGLWISNVLGMFLILFIYNPIKTLVLIILKIIVLIIKLVYAIVSLIKNKGKLLPLSGLAERVVLFIEKLGRIKRYKGNNGYLKHLSDKAIGRHAGILYIEIFTFILLLLFFLPFALIILNTTKTANEIVADPLAFAGSTETFWKNLTNILTSTRVRYWNSFFNSLLITSGSLMTIGIFSAMAAWVLVRTKKKYSKFIFLLFLSGMVIPFQVVMLPLVRLLELITVNFGINMKDTYHGIILVYIGFGAPLSVFMFHGFIKSIPMDIEEAAIIDGCSRPQLFFRIIIPILKPIFVTLLVLNGLWIWNDYLLPSLVIGITGEVRTLPLAVANLAGAYVRQWDLLLTSVMLAAIPVIILFLFAQKFIIQGMTSGAIK